MSIMVKSLWVVLLLGLTIGCVALSMFGIPSPSVEVTKVIPNENFNLR